MSDTTARARIDNPFDGGMQFEPPPGGGREMVPVAGAATDRAQAAIVTAQRVAIKRNLPSILAEAKALATAAGDKFYYSMPFKEKDKDGVERTVLVEGPSIGCAMAALSCYGNDAVEAFPAAETQTHWTFMARFCDFEKGVTVTRSFQQRKGQNVGIRDRGRSEDLVFQIGQSKAIRNVIIGGIKWLTDEMFAAAKSGVLDRIGKAPDKARAWLVDKLQQAEVDLKRVERVIGRTAPHWSVRDMARIFSELQAIEDGFADADDLYPASQTEAEQMRDDINAQQSKDAPPPTQGADGRAQGQQQQNSATGPTGAASGSTDQPKETGAAADKAAAGGKGTTTRKRNTEKRLEAAGAAAEGGEPARTSEQQAEEAAGAPGGGGAATSGPADPASSTPETEGAEESPGESAEGDEGEENQGGLVFE